MLRRFISIKLLKDINNMVVKFLNLKLSGPNYINLN